MFFSTLKVYGEKEYSRTIEAFNQIWSASLCTVASECIVRIFNIDGRVVNFYTCFSVKA